MNSIHPTAVVTGDVVLGDDNSVGPFAVLQGPLRIGDGNWIGAGVVIGAAPEVRGFDHSGATSTGGVFIGSDNVIREYAQIHGGWKSRTTVGDDCFIMNQVYVAHDGTLGDRVTLASSALLAGHVSVGDGANVGMGTTVHQFRSIGGGAMVGMSSVVTADVPAFALAYGSPARVHGANRVGLRRAGLADDLIERVHAAYLVGEGLDPRELALPEEIARLLERRTRD